MTHLVTPGWTFFTLPTSIDQDSCCKSYRLILLATYTTHLCQPLDRSCFIPLKKAYNNECHLYMSCNPGKAVNGFNFTKIFSQAWTKAMMGLFLLVYSPSKSHPCTCTSDSESIDYYEENTCSEDSTCGYYGKFSEDKDYITKVQPSTIHDFLTMIFLLYLSYQVMRRKQNTVLVF